MQDFTGGPCVVDLVAMRDAIIALGGDPQRINPLVPSELVIDHSVIADVFGRPNAAAANSELEFQRNVERYQLLRRSEEHTSELQSLMRISYAVFCLKKNTDISTYTKLK